MARWRSRLIRRREGEHTGTRLLVALLLSLGANLAIWGFLAGRGAFTPPSVSSAPRPVALAPLGGAEWEANRKIEPEPPRRRAPPHEPEPGGEIVELPPDDAPAEAPDEARYLSDRDRRVERETVSRHAGNYPNLLPTPQPGSPGRPAAGEGGRAERSERREAAEERANRAQRTEREEARDAVAMARTPQREAGEEGVPRDDEAPSPPSPMPGAERKRGPEKPDLSLGPETMARLQGGPGMAGYNQAEEGDVTALNTRDGGEIARYYIRAGWKIEPDWVRRVRRAAQERDPQGELFFYKERSVVIGATLDRDGNLMEVTIVRSSNVDFFDGVAVASVRQAQPFPPPPSAMLFDGRARMAWTFTLYPPESRSSVSGRPWR
jgi:TonB family protein